MTHAGQLLVCRNRKHGHAFLPGGHIEHGESARAALEREMREELGQTLRATRFLGACEAMFHEARARRAGVLVHEVNLVFQLELPPGQAVIPADFVSRERKIVFVWIDAAGGLAHANILPPPITKLIEGSMTWATSME